LVRIAETPLPDPGPDVYLVAVGDAAGRKALLLAEELRAAAGGLSVEVNAGGGSFKSQFKRADKSGARLAVILGEEELAAGQAGLKDLRGGADQRTVAWNELTSAIAQSLQAQ
ncbi:MAG: histidine--tRNA ligase, partial [Gammaproteobacteria bacterium]|nr:histidine--tRNA ligase [Gammaproteobacteria bacterium]